MGLLRRILVLACIGGGAWLAWGQAAPEGADWLQPALDQVQQRFDDAGVAPRLVRTFIGGGAGALLAFLLCGGLWRPLRFLSMLLLLGLGAGAGWYVATQMTIDWLPQEFNVEGMIPTMLVTAAAAALLLGLYDLVRPGPADAQLSNATAFRRLIVPVLVVVAGWLTWEVAAPQGAEWLQPTLDAIQGKFDEVSLRPPLGRALVGAGAAGLLAFLLGGALWRRGRFVGMSFVLGAGAAVGWALTTEALADWSSRELDIEGLVPALMVGVAGAGLLLGVLEWLRPAAGGARAGWRTLVKSGKVEVALAASGKRLGIFWPGNSFELKCEPLRHDRTTMVRTLTRSLHECYLPADALSEDAFDKIFAALQNAPAPQGKLGRSAPPA
jgi:hypothetical protein